MSKTHEELVAAAAADIHEEFGWLSDAQHAQLDYDASSKSIHFCGDGSIDLGHLVSLILHEQRPRRMTSDEYKEAMRERDEAEAKEGIYDY